MATRYNSLREVSNLPFDAKSRSAAAVTAESRSAGSLSARLSQEVPARSSRNSGMVSPRADAKNAHIPSKCGDIAADIVEMFLLREKQVVRDSRYLSTHKEINEKMRTILIDWLVDVHLKFKLHEETFFLAVDIVDRFLAQARVQRSQLQLVGITAILIAAKYEEIWPPEIKDCVHIAAQTYTQNEILEMERNICATLQFKLTVPTPFVFLVRLLEISEADDQLRHTAFFYLEHALLDYRHLQYLPSELANASFYLANLMLKKPEPWSYSCQYYSKAAKEDFRSCASEILEYAVQTTNSKYQAIRRKYSNPKFGEVSRMVFPTELL